MLRVDLQKYKGYIFRTFLLVAAVISFIFFSYHIIYSQRIIPGVNIAKVNVGGKNYLEAKQVLTSELNPKLISKVEIQGPTKNYTFNDSDLGIKYDTDQTLRNAFKAGRSGNLINDIGTEIKAAVKNMALDPAVSVEEATLSGRLALLAQEIDEPFSNAIFTANNGTINISPAREGTVVDQENLKRTVIERHQKISNEIIKLPLTNKKPNIVASDLETIKPQIQFMVENPPKLTYEQKVWTPTANEIIEFISFQKTGKNLSIKINSSAVESYIAKIGSEINREPKGNILQMDGNRVSKFDLAEDGKKLDEKQAVQLLNNALTQKDTTPIALTVNTYKPPEGGNTYGIRELLGGGQSNFAGSIQGRINNIVTATNKIKGTIVPPGGEFSFNKILGDVSAATGYDQAYIIQEGRTVLGTGGGVCQVSTTVFRAAFNSGLQITKRSAHAYRVGYYEPPVGFDATVYAPEPDLVFKNDTNNYILLWAEVNVPNATLTFKIYGTNDGRTVKTIGPVMSTQTPPPEPIYQPDPTLPTGVVKQIDWAVWGAHVELGREVYRNGEIMHKDTFVSQYQPWHAVYLVGTKN